MNIKIMTQVFAVVPVQSDDDAIEVKRRRASEISTFEDEIKEFLADKSNAKIRWFQSSASIFEMSFGSVSSAFTQITAIIEW
jgi:hypothetical protein